MTEQELSVATARDLPDAVAKLLGDWIRPWALSRSFGWDNCYCIRNGLPRCSLKAPLRLELVARSVSEEPSNKRFSIRPSLTLRATWSFETVSSEGLFRCRRPVTLVVTKCQ